MEWLIFILIIIILHLVNSYSKEYYLYIILNLHETYFIKNYYKGEKYIIYIEYGSTITVQRDDKQLYVVSYNIFWSHTWHKSITDKEQQEIRQKLKTLAKTYKWK